MGEVSQAVILAGGRGTRLAPFTDNSPKPMYPIHGTPFIEYLIRQVQDFGIGEILILLGYMPEKIQGYLGDGGRLGVRITYDVTPAAYSTGDRLLNAAGQIRDRFLLMYCDNYCPIDYVRLEREFLANNAWIQATAYENRDGYTRSNLAVDDGGRVLAYDRSRSMPGLLGVDIGYALVDKRALAYIGGPGAGFEASAYPRAVAQGRMYATSTKHRYYSIGSWERMGLAEQFFEGRPTVFLDRDGTLNRKPPRGCYVEGPEGFVWLERAREAIARLKGAGYRVLLATNQPGIARGKLTEEALEEIHRRMCAELEEAGGAIDRIYYCPHGWDEGCECRKPAPGMLYQAQKDFCLNLPECIMIGDDDRDMEAGERAGCRCIRVSEQYSLYQAVEDLLAGHPRLEGRGRQEGKGL